MEKLIKYYILTFFLVHTLFTSDQHGFLPSQSTCTEMLECYSDRCSSLDSKSFVDIIVIDFSKAFEVMPHAKLICELASLGICTATLQWRQAFLSGRQSIKINNHLSISSLVTSDIIQGNMFGPTLFILYINNLPATCKNNKFKLFADDANGYKTIKHQSDRVALQYSLDALCEWSAK